MVFWSRLGITLILPHCMLITSALCSNIHRPSVSTVPYTAWWILWTHLLLNKGHHYTLHVSLTVWVHLVHRRHFACFHHGNEAYVPEATTIMAHNVHGHPQDSRFESTETSNIMENNLVSSPNEPHIQGNGELQIVTSDHRKLSIRSPQADIETNLHTPQVGITSVSSRGRNCKITATILLCQSMKCLWPIILPFCLIHLCIISFPKCWWWQRKTWCGTPTTR